VPEAAPPLEPAQIDYVTNAASILVGTCSASLAPECVRAVGIRVHPGGGRVTVLVPTVLAGRTLDNLTSGPRIAVTTASLPTYSTIQLKGLARNVRDATGDDRALADAFLAKFQAEFAWADARARQRPLTTWPCKAIDVDIETLYLEAPAPLTP
jgi:hypothetical protein